MKTGPFVRPESKRQLFTIVLERKWDSFSVFLFKLSEFTYQSRWNNNKFRAWNLIWICGALINKKAKEWKSTQAQSVASFRQLSPEQPVYIVWTKCVSPALTPQTTASLCMSDFDVQSVDICDYNTWITWIAGSCILLTASWLHQLLFCSVSNYFFSVKSIREIAIVKKLLINNYTMVAMFRHVPIKNATWF